MIKKTLLGHKKTLTGLFWRSIQIFTKHGLNLFILLLCAKLLTPFEFGLYTYIYAIVVILALFGDFGISTSTAKYVAQYNATDKKKVKLVLFNMALLVLTLSLIVIGITLIFGPVYLKEKYIYLVYILPIIFLSPITSLFDGIYRGLEKFRKMSLITLIVGIISIIITYISITKYGLVGALISQNVFYLLLLICYLLGYGLIKIRFDKVIVKEIGKYSLIYGLVMFGNILFIRSGIIILGHYNYLVELATYELLNKIFMTLVTPFILLGHVVGPQISVLKARKRNKEILEKLKKYIYYFFISGTIAGAICYFILPIVFKVWLENYYNEIFLSMFPITLINFVTNIWMATIIFGIVVSVGYADILAKIYMIIGAIGVLTSLILINIIGYMGVIYSFAICNILMVIGVIFFVNQRLRTDVS